MGMFGALGGAMKAASPARMPGMQPLNKAVNKITPGMGGVNKHLGIGPSQNSMEQRGGGLAGKFGVGQQQQQPQAQAPNMYSAPDQNGMVTGSGSNNNIPQPYQPPQMQAPAGDIGPSPEVIQQASPVGDRMEMPLTENVSARPDAPFNMNPQEGMQAQNSPMTMWQRMLANQYQQQNGGQMRPGMGGGNGGGMFGGMKKAGGSFMRSMV